MEIPAPDVAAGATPAAPQPALSGSAASESSTEEQGGSETSLGTSLTMSPPHPHPHGGPTGAPHDADRQLERAESQEQQREDLEEEEEEELVGERPRARRRNRRRAYSLSLMGTSADSGLSVTAEVEGRLWDGAAGSPQYSNALHHLWMMSYSRSAPYLSSDDSDSDSEEILEELQDLREK